MHESAAIPHMIMRDIKHPSRLHPKLNTLYEPSLTPPSPPLRPPPRVIFTLREPAARSYSDFRYLIHQYAPYDISFHKVAIKSMQRLSDPSCLGVNLMERLLGMTPALMLNSSRVGPVNSKKTTVDHLREGLKENNKDRKTLHSSYFYQTSCGRIEADPSEIIKRSLYVFMIHHWQTVLGSNHILVVNAADFEPKADDQTVETGRARRVLADIIDFVGLCQFDFDESILSKRRNVNRAKPGSTMLSTNPATTALLRSFFYPYNEALYRIIERNFSWPVK